MSRKNHDGSFRKLPNGTIEFAVSTGFDAYGKHQRKRFYGKTELECRKKHKEFIKAGEKQPVKIKEYTLSKWLDEWLRIYKENNVQASTYDEYVSFSCHIKRHKIGNMKLSQIKPIHVTEYFSSKIKYSHSYRKRSKFLINAAFESAIDNDFCLKNPVRRAEIAKKAQPEREAYTEEETQVIIDFAKSDEIFGLSIYIMLNTGIRSGEMRALTVDRIDFDNGIIKIDRAVKHTEELGKPKNGKTRYIPLEEDVTDFLKSKLQGKTGYIVSGDYYVSRAGFRSRYLHFFNRLDKYLKENGALPVKRKSPHSTRHTFGTLRQKNGMPIAMVAALLGHCSTEVTDKYTHLGDVSTLSEAVKKYPYLSTIA
ncbi:MAG: site-specific integrase [Oscillospiraceae bacterium]|nr:site-specific integrase [Oscillospiraceae bacterium]